MKKTKNTRIKIGDKVQSFLYTSNWKKIKISGIVKDVKIQFGKKTYILGNWVGEDLVLRKVKRISK